MSFCTVNGEGILTADITIPLTGCWVADIHMIGDPSILTPVALVVGDLTLIGAVAREASFSGARSARLVGGFAGWRQPVPKKWYSNGVLLSQVVNDLAKLVGETVLLTADRVLGSFTREDGAPASRVLNQLFGPTQWYVREDGVTVLGATRPTSLITSEFQTMRYFGGGGRWIITTDVYSDWLPGRTFTSTLTDTTVNTIGAVCHMISHDKVRTEVLSSP